MLLAWLSFAPPPQLLYEFKLITQVVLLSLSCRSRQISKILAFSRLTAGTAISCHSFPTLQQLVLAISTKIRCNSLQWSALPSSWYAGSQIYSWDQSFSPWSQSRTSIFIFFVPKFYGPTFWTQNLFGSSFFWPKPNFCTQYFLGWYFFSIKLG